MDKDISLVIRGNINSSIERIEQLRIEREEREKKEREERWRLEREERERKEEEWKKAHPILDKYTYISYHSYETYSWQGEYCNVRFYEFSDINRSPRHFPYTTEFFKFLDKYGIMPTQEDVNKFKHCSGCHIVCKPGCSEVIVGKTYEEMKEKFELYALASKLVSTVPDIDDAS